MVFGLIKRATLLLVAIGFAGADNGGIDLSVLSVPSASVASLGISTDFSTVDYRARTTTMNLIDYCSDPKCGACSMLPSSDPCQVCGMVES